MQAIATEAVGPRCSNASPLWTLQWLRFGSDVAAAPADRVENRDPGINADGSHVYGGRCANLPDHGQEAIIGPDIPSMSIVLDTIKAKPDGGRIRAANLDSVCAR